MLATETSAQASLLMRLRYYGYKPAGVHTLMGSCLNAGASGAPSPRVATPSAQLWTITSAGQIQPVQHAGALAGKDMQTSLKLSMLEVLELNEGKTFRGNLPHRTGQASEPAHTTHT